MKLQTFFKLFFLTITLFVLYSACVNIRNKSAAAKPPAAYDDALFREHVRTSEAKTPEEEKASFSLPHGFEISLFASEPLIGKPINMNFDEKGRLWVTQSFEYPFAAAPGKGKDMITILEDKNGDGKADAFTHFADSLNIPIGVMPVTGGALAYSIPYIYRFTDKDGDGKAESKKALIGPFGFKDTHGMVNSLTRGYDGWINSDHGFSNTSKVSGADGDSITMESGNTFRFLPDGSRVEQTTFGRVNPFGICFDEWGYQYSSDCHSSPIYQLIQGADYPHFGKAEDGIGFAPAMKPHDDESTALAGLAYYNALEFPQEYQNDLYLGDVVKARIYRNSFSFKGATPVAKREKDFLISSDPWFRPVDVKLGPDGALYVADFYNRIIGHYEVPLTHPGRDHIKGRIWRITYKNKTVKPKDLSRAGTRDLIASLNNPNITVRMQAADQLVDRIGMGAVSEAMSALKGKTTSPIQFIQALWVLERLNSLPQDVLLKALENKEPLIKVHALRIVAKRKDNKTYFAAAGRSLQNENPHVRRAAAEAMMQFSSLASVEGLLKLDHGIDSADSHLRYTTRLSLRNILRNERLTKEVAGREWTDIDMATLAKVMTGVQNKPAAAFLFEYLKQNQGLSKENQMIFLQQVARFQAAENAGDLVRFTTSRFAEDADAQYKIFNIIQQGLDQAGIAAGKEMKDWGISLAEKYIRSIGTGWQYTTGTNILTRNPLSLDKGWISGTSVIGFDQGGLKGSIFSPVFEVPASLKFLLAFRDPPEANVSDTALQEVRLISANDNKVLKVQKFKRDLNYLEPAVSWDLSAFKGRKAFLEIVNNSPQGGFLKIGAFDPAVARLPEKSPSQTANLQLFALQIAGKYEVAGLVPAIKEVLNKNTEEYFLKVAAMRALMQINDKEYAPIINASLHVKNIPDAYKKDLITLLGEFPSATASNVLNHNFSSLSKDLQIETARALVNSSEGIDVVLKRVRTGDIYTRVLLEPKIEERLAAVASSKQLKEYKELIVNLNPVDEERQQLIKDRLAAFKYSPDYIVEGHAVFTQNCSPCHRIKKEGGMIGPQLDGIGNWGATALAEKVLNPNQNISEAFRNYTIKLKNGKVMTGLYRREEGEVTVFANASGEEFRLLKKDITERKGSKYTLMPDHFGKVISPEKFNTLLSFLLSNK